VKRLTYKPNMGEEGTPRELDQVSQEKVNERIK
jgi:hypothetical protein